MWGGTLAFVLVLIKNCWVAILLGCQSRETLTKDRLVYNEFKKNDLN